MSGLRVSIAPSSPARPRLMARLWRSAKIQRQFFLVAANPPALNAANSGARGKEPATKQVVLAACAILQPYDFFRQLGMALNSTLIMSSALSSRCLMISKASVGDYIRYSTIVSIVVHAAWHPIFAAKRVTARTIVFGDAWQYANTENYINVRAPSTAKCRPSAVACSWINRPFCAR
jgi:hypothetical protein